MADIQLKVSTAQYSSFWRINESAEFVNFLTVPI